MCRRRRSPPPGVRAPYSGEQQLNRVGTPVANPYTLWGCEPRDTGQCVYCAIAAPANNQATAAGQIDAPCAKAQGPYAKRVGSNHETCRDEMSSYIGFFKTRRRGTYTETDLFIQQTFGNRDPQVARVTLSYRFGKPDISLFKRKNNKVSSNGMDMMQ